MAGKKKSSKAGEQEAVREQLTCLDFVEHARDGVELFGLGDEGGRGRLVLDQRTGVDDEAVDALLLRLVGWCCGILGRHIRSDDCETVAFAC